MGEMNVSRYRHNNLDMRKSIESLLDDGKSVSAIAGRLGVAPTGAPVQEMRRSEIATNEPTGVSSGDRRLRNRHGHRQRF